MEQRTAGIKFSPSDTVDFAIVGSGAAGGILAKELSTAGFSVVVLEQGPRLTESQFDHDEFGTFMQSKNSNNPAMQPQSFRATPSDKAQRALALIYGRLVGGSNAHFTANFWRLRPIDFNEASTLGGVPGTGLVDWPITYDELEPYYTKAEWELGVSGEPGPFDPPRSRPYPMPPLPVKSSGVLLEQGARALGLSPAVNADGDQLAVLQRPARVPALRLLPVLHVRVPLEVNVHDHDAARGGSDGPLRDPRRAATSHGSRPIESGRATGVAYFDAQKRLQLQRAKAVVLCANGAETPRLLLNSESSRFPNGLANSSGAVGKYLMFNTYYGVNAQFEHPLNEYKSVQNTRMILDFYDTDPKRGFYGGGGIDARFGKYPDHLRARRASAGLADVGRGLRARPRRAVPAHDVLRHARHVAAARDQQRHDRSVAQGCVGPPLHARHLQRSSRTT